MQIAVVFSLGLLLAASPAKAWEGGAGIPQIASQSGNKESMSTSHNGSRNAAAGGNRSATISRGAAPAELCSTSGTGERITANPSNYAHIMRTLRPGQTMLLAPGNYPRLNIVNLRGQPGKCIVITGPKDGPPAVIHGVPRFNTVDIVNSSYVALKNVLIDSRGIPGAFGISAGRGTSSVTHHILIEGNTLIGQGGAQQTDGISTNTPTWGWVIRRNKILGAGTGVYLGNSDGSSPFFDGIIEDNLIQDSIGYCLQIKYQSPRPAVPGMPTRPSVTIIRDNVFIKNDQPSPDGDRPNLLVGGFPESGPGAQDRYEIYGNLLYHNPREALFQASGRVSFHDNILVGGQAAAAVFRDHDLPLKVAYVYNNTIYTNRTGIHFENAAAEDDAVVGNLVFAATPINGPIRHLRGNIGDSVANAAQYVNGPSFSLKSMDFYPSDKRAQGDPLDLSQFAREVDYQLDFNHHPKGKRAFRGAYAGSGRNPGWKPAAELKVVRRKTN